MCENSVQLICGGELEIVKITPDLYDEAVQLYAENFMQQENVCLATQVPSSPEASEELKSLVRGLLHDGISFAARHCATGQLASICVNHMMTAAPHNATVADIVTKFTSPQLICILDYLQRMETTFDLYKEWNVDCVMEIVFLSTRPQFLQRGIASILSQHSIDYARRILTETLPPQDPPLPEHVRGLKPKAVCSIFTSFYTQRIGRKFNFEILTKIPYTEFVYEGKTFAERLDPIHEFSTFEALRL